MAEPVKVGGVVVGFFNNGRFEFSPYDVRGTALPRGDAVKKWAEPFGSREQNADIRLAFDYAGNYKDPDSGLVIMGLRFYDPILGMFTTPDQAFLEDLKLCQSSPTECNLFGYGQNNPVKFTDPTGKFAWVVPLLAYAAWELTDSDTAEAPGLKDHPQSNGTGLDQQQQRAVDKGVDFIAKAIDKAVPGPNVIAPTVKMAKEAYKQDRKSGVPDSDFQPKMDISEKYKRPSGAGPTKAQKESVQGLPCVDCGAITPKQVADHKDPLVVQYYREGKVNVDQQSKVDAVQPHCPSCSSTQGGQLGAFSRKMSDILGL